jgi:cytochrome c peroxidase
MQYEDKTGQLMMLPSDLALIQDPTFKNYVELYAKDEGRFTLVLFF